MKNKQKIKYKVSRRKETRDKNINDKENHKAVFINHCQIFHLWNLCFLFMQTLALSDHIFLEKNTPEDISTELEAVTTTWSLELLIPMNEPVEKNYNIGRSNCHWLPWKLGLLLHNGVSKEHIQKPGDSLKHLLVLP